MRASLRAQKLKVAFIGNMNNNFFAMSRYMRDEGYNCELLLFVNELAHFHPECDTYDSRHKTWVKRLNWGKGHQVNEVERRFLQRDLQQYDIFVGCGWSPAFLHKAGYALDVMVPYGGDIRSLPVYKKSIFQLFKRHYPPGYFQRKGLAKVKVMHLGNAEAQSDYFDHCKLLAPDATFWTACPPIVYSRQYEETGVFKNSIFFEAFKKIRVESEFLVISHGRHIWGDLQNKSTKGNDILIHGWKLFCQANPSLKKTLVFFDFGSGVQHSKSLVSELGLDSTIVWLPSMGRKDLMAGVSMADVVAAEFIHSWIAGGVIFEALVLGKPLLMRSSAHEDPSCANDLYPIYNAGTPRQIACHLQSYLENPSHGKWMGEKGKNWYQRNVVDKSINLYSGFFEEKAIELGRYFF